MTVQGGKHQLVGMVSLGKVHQDMKHVETGWSNDYSYNYDD